MIPFDNNEWKPAAQVKKKVFIPNALLQSKASAVAFLIFIFCVCLCIHLYSRWVNALGMAAVQGIDVVLRHSFFDYGYTHLVDQNFNPLPVSLSISVQQ